MRIGVLCSGGDAPGMNACVRAVVRSAAARGHQVVGIRRGYRGLVEETFYVGEGGGIELTPRDVSDWGRHGGTFLHSSRCPEFLEAEGRDRAASAMAKHGLEALVVVGGDGSFRGATAFSQHFSGPIVGCPGTIDNDLLGTDFTIGFSTAVRTATEAVDMLRDTAESHERMFLIEVMGRHSGYIAAITALAGSAETVCIPETPTDVPAMVDYLRRLKKRGKSSVMMIVAEGDEAGGAEILHRRLEEAGCPFPMRVLILGHLQRGGCPTPEDRVLATRLGDAAVSAILDGKSGVMAGVVGRETVWTPFEQTYAGHKPIAPEFLELLDRMAH